MNEYDQKYLSIILGPIKLCANYQPKFGHGKKEGYNLETFQKLYKSDPFYYWFGLDNPLMYAAHKAAGGITSIYRQVGIGCEQLFRTILQDQFDLSEEDTKWSYQIPTSEGRKRTLSLDGRIPLKNVKNSEKRERIHQWIKEAAKDLDVDDAIIENMKGVVFEIRQGYKSKDSKRQHADITNAAVAYTKSYFPSVVVLSTQIDDEIVTRYRAEKWFLMVGSTEKGNSLYSTYEFMKSIIGYDMAAFFERNSDIIKGELDKVLKILLSPEK